jgi:hypothetical protein
VKLWGDGEKMAIYELKIEAPQGTTIADIWI